MSSFAKLAAVLSAGLLATVAAADTKAVDDKSKKPDSTPSPKEGTDKKGKKDKKKEVVKTPEDPNAPQKPIQVPIPNGHDAVGLKIPYRDAAGNLKMRFTIGVATKVDENHMDLAQTQVETFNDQGEHEMDIDLPKSTLELATWDLTAHQAVTIKREDFELTGNAMIFNLKTKVGGLDGDVRMTIYNLAEETGQKPDGDKPADATVAPAADKPAASPSPAAESPAPPAPKAK